MKKSVMLIIGFLLLLSSILFIISEISQPSLQFISYSDYIRLVGVEIWIVWIIRYFIIYPVTGYLLFKEVNKK